MKIDFFATWTHYADHMAPVFEELEEERGDFFVSHEVHDHLIGKGIPSTRDLAPESENPVVVASNSDLRLAYVTNPHRKFVLMEHGVGIVFPGNPSYAGGVGHRKHASLTLAPNQFIHELTAKTFPDMKQAIIGTPKMDEWSRYRYTTGDYPTKPTVAVTFHWDGSMVAPEAGNAFRHYKGVLSKLNNRYDMNLIAHVHPKSSPEMKRFFDVVGIKLFKRLDDVFHKADILVNDCSSILYEFMLLGKPVIIMNAPWFRKEVDFGPRFWRYTDIGEQIEGPEGLLPAIQRAYKTLPDYQEARKRAQRELYPYFGVAREVAAREIRRFLEGS